MWVTTIHFASSTTHTKCNVINLYSGLQSTLTVVCLLAEMCLWHNSPLTHTYLLFSLYFHASVGTCSSDYLTRAYLVNVCNNPCTLLVFTAGLLCGVVDPCYEMLVFVSVGVQQQRQLLTETFTATPRCGDRASRSCRSGVGVLTPACTDITYNSRAELRPIRSDNNINTAQGRHRDCLRSNSLARWTSYRPWTCEEHGFRQD